MKDRFMRFEICPHCGWDPGTDEGEKACSYGVCANIPEELNVFCDYCHFNLLTMEGNSPCDDPIKCDHSIEPLVHAENYRRWAAERQPQSQPIAPIAGVPASIEGAKS